jgi:hypothetical protein
MSADPRKRFLAMRSVGRQKGLRAVLQKRLFFSQGRDINRLLEAPHSANPSVVTPAQMGRAR